MLNGKINYTKFGFVIALFSFLLSLYYNNVNINLQNETKEIQKKKIVREEINNKINYALDLISEGDSLQNNLAEKYINVEEILIGDKLKSFNLIKAGLDSLEKIRNTYKNCDAIKHLIRFYSRNPKFKSKVNKLRDDLLNNCKKYYE